MLLSARERERYNGLTGGRADAFLAGRALLRSLLGELVGMDARDVPLAAECPDCGGEHGAPVIPGYAMGISLAHVDDVVVAVAQSGARVGVDVELRTQSAERLDAIAEVTGHRSVQHWTRVEAVLKADGRGLRVDPRTVIIEGDRATVNGGPVGYRVREVDLADDLCVSIAVAEP